jgi:hypothetical protein
MCIWYASIVLLAATSVHDPAGTNEQQQVNLIQTNQQRLQQNATVDGKPLTKIK